MCSFASPLAVNEGCAAEALLHSLIPVVGQMRYNSRSQKWEGNDAALSAFDGPVSASSRPALITGTSISSMASLSFPASPSTAHMPVPHGAKVVGNMRFDTAEMRWVSLLSPEEDEPDCFEGIDDDSSSSLDLHPIEDDDTMDVTSSSSRPRHSLASSSEGANADVWRGREAERVDFARRCRLAEEGHRAEVAGWNLASSSSSEVGLWAGGGGAEQARGRRREEERLFEIVRVARIAAGKT